MLSVVMIFYDYFQVLCSYFCLHILQNERNCSELEKKIIDEEKESLQWGLDSNQEKLDNMRKLMEELELKSKADIKVLVKEVKVLRKSQAELKEMLNQSLKEKTELEVRCKSFYRCIVLDLICSTFTFDPGSCTQGKAEMVECKVSERYSSS